MADGSKTILGVDQSLLDFVQTLNQYNDILLRLPTKHQILMKTLGPLYTTYLKMDMGLKSVSTVMTKTEKATGKLAKATKLLAVPAVVVAGAFSGILTAMLPLLGIVFGVVGGLMLLTAAFDQGGGSLRTWLEDMPILGEIFTVVQTGADAVRAGLSGEGGPFGGLIDGLKSIVTFYAEFYTVVFLGLKDFITMLADSGIFTTILDGLTTVGEEIMGLWTVILSIFGDGGTDEFFAKLETLIGSILGWLEGIGIFDFINAVAEVGYELLATVIFLVAQIIKVVVRIIRFLVPIFAPYAKILLNYFGIVYSVVAAVINTVLKLIGAALAALRGDFGRAKELIVSIGSVWTNTFNRVKTFTENIFDAIMQYIQPVLDAMGAVGDFVGGAVGGVVGGATSLLGFSSGGVATGPKSGYAVALHGTEAVVPLPDGRSIPVTIESMGGGGGATTVNINVSGANGDPQRIARAVSEEVGRLFRSRANNGGISRGV